MIFDGLITIFDNMFPLLDLINSMYRERIDAAKYYFNKYVITMLRLFTMFYLLFSSGYNLFFQDNKIMERNSLLIFILSIIGIGILGAFIFYLQCFDPVKVEEKTKCVKENKIELPFDKD